MASVTRSNNIRISDGDKPTEWGNVTHVRLAEWPSREQVEWGHNDDPQDFPQMELGDVYELERVELHSWHTKLFLVGVAGKGFNSVSFKAVAVDA